MARTPSWFLSVGVLLMLALPASAALAGESTAVRSGDTTREPPWAGVSGALFDINVHTREELELVLQRMEALARAPAPAGRPERIALVLHGPEVAFFAARNYPEYRDLVDLAARLSAFGFIDIKMCRTRMRQLGIEAGEIPPFIELVPYGPAEAERLRARSYVVM